MKVWPLKITACLTDGKNMITEKNEYFGAKLESEKEAFSKLITRFQQSFEKIKEFKNLTGVEAFFRDTLTLRKELEKAFAQVQQFHDRETQFGLPITLYPELDAVADEFKPFDALITLSHETINSINDWKTETLKGRDPNLIASTVSGWHSECMKLYKKLNEDHPDTAEVAQELKKIISEFSLNLPLIKCFTSEAIGDDDWAEIKERTGINVERDDIKVSMFAELELQKYVEDIEEITMRAEKKHSLGIKLAQMKAEMKVF